METTPPSAVFAFISETREPLAETDSDPVWLSCTDFSVEIAELRLALADASADTSKLVPTDKDATDVLSAVDSAANADDTPKWVSRRTEVAPDADTESDVATDWRVLFSTDSATVKDAVPDTTDDAAALTTLEASDTVWLRATDSLEMPVLMDASDETRADRCVLIAVDRDVTVDARVLTSELCAALNPASTTLNEADDALTVVDRDVAMDARVLTSVLSAALNPASTTLNEADDALTAVDRDVVSLLRLLISAPSPVLSTACVDNSDELAVLRASESDVTAEPRVLTSDAMEFNKTVLPFVILAASDGSFPMAVAMSDSVLSVDVSPSPAMAASLPFTKGSVAIALLLSLG